MPPAIPTTLVAELNGRVWKKAIARSELADYQQRFQRDLHAAVRGTNLLHVLAG